MKRRINNSEKREVRSINFDKVVIDNIEARARKLGMSLSECVNIMCRQVAMSDESFYRDLARFHHMKREEAMMMAERAKSMKQEG